MPSPRLTILLALVAAAFAVLPQSASAGRWLPSKAVSQTGASAPQVAMGPQGNATIVFLRDGLLRAVGRAPRGGFKSLGALSGPGASAPYLAVGRSGAVGATWIEQTGASSWTIRSARRTGSGAFRDVRTVASGSARPHAPRIDLDASGDPTVAWTVDQPGANEPRIIRIATGNAGGSYGPVDSSPQEPFLGDLDLKVDGAGKATVSWQSRPCIAPCPTACTITCPQWQVRAATRNAGGALSGSQTIEASADDTATPRPALGIDAAGNVTAVWRIVCGAATPQCAPEPNGQYIRTATRDAAAPLFGPATFLSNSEVGAIDGPVELAVGRSGEAFAGYVPECSFGCRPTAVRRRALSSFGTPESLDPSQGSQIEFAAGGSGRVLSVWRRSSTGRVMARAGRAPTGWGTTRTISATGASDPDVAQDGSGNGVGVFERGGEIRAALYDDQPPVIDEVHMPARFRAGRKVTFSARAHDDFSAVRGRWDWGTSARDSGFKVRHGYRNTGRYDVTFTATDAAGNSSSVTRTVRVTARPDRTRPRVKLRVKRSVHRNRILMGLHLRVICSEGCLATATMRRGYLIARARDARDRPGLTHIFLKPRGKARRRFRANPPSSVVVRVTAIDYAGNRSKPRAKRVYVR